MRNLGTAPARLATSLAPVVGALAGLCCFGFTGVSSLMVVLGLAWFRTHVHPVLYLTLPLNLTLLGLGYSQHRRLLPLALAAAGSLSLLYAYHHALDVRLFLGLLYGGGASLLAGAAVELAHQRRCRVRA